MRTRKLISVVAAGAPHSFHSAPFCTTSRPRWLSSLIWMETPRSDVFSWPPLAYICCLFGTEAAVTSDFLCRCFVCLWQTDYYYEYTECDSTGSRWRVAIPHSHGACVGLPEPVRGTECSKSEVTVFLCVWTRVCGQEGWNFHHCNLNGSQANTEQSFRPVKVTGLKLCQEKTAGYCHIISLCSTSCIICGQCWFTRIFIWLIQGQEIGRCGWRWHDA